MQLKFWATALLVPFAAAQVRVAGVKGAAQGAAHGVTGGGNAAPVTPQNTAQLVSYLQDSSPRVILITKTFDFRNTMGSTTEVGCVPASNKCGNKGQNSINANNWCGNNPKTKVTYDKAGTTPIYVKSNKSIVGVGNAGVIIGRGLYVKDASNVIIQNVHITNLNPHLIWGGDAISLVGTDLIWIDHCKFSLIGRQMLVTGYKAAGRVTISNNEFDGQTSWSSSCNGQHYWTMLFYGAADYITLVGNYIHHVSGRAPKVGGSGTIFMHAVNNYFAEVGGHDFDIRQGGNVMVEGNYFKSVNTPFTADTTNGGGAVFNSVNGWEKTCNKWLGRDCMKNVIYKSGAVNKFTTTNFFSTIQQKEGGHVPNAMDVTAIPNYVPSHAGIGKI